MKIAVDIDDTLNIVDRAGRAGAYIERNKLPFKQVDEHANMLVNVFDWSYDDVTAFIRDGGISAFTEAEARAGAREALASWKEDGHEIVVLTARKKEWFGNPVNLSRDWLEKRRIPYDSIVAETEDKGKYCAENGISVLVEDNPDICLGAQAYGVHAVLAVAKHNLARAQEIAFGGANWKQIDAQVRRIAEIVDLEIRASRFCPARKREFLNGWELRSDVWKACRGTHVYPALPSRVPLWENIAACEEKYGAANLPCRFRVTQLDNELDAALVARGYRIEKNIVCMKMEKIPVYLRTGNVRVYGDPSEWIKDLRAVSGNTGMLRSYALIRGENVFVTAYDGTVPVAVGMGTVEDGVAGLYDVHVRENYRRLGYGKLVCERVLAECKRLGARCACLHAEQSNLAALALYRKTGFEKVYDYWYRIKEENK